MLKKCTPLWREAHVEVKMFRARRVRTTCRRSDVVCVAGARDCAPVKSEQDVGVCSIFNYKHHTTLQHTTLQLQLHLHYIPLHATTLHYTPLHYTTLQYTTVHYTTLHYTTLNDTALHLQLQTATATATALHYATLMTLHYTTSP